MKSIEKEIYSLEGKLKLIEDTLKRINKHKVETLVQIHKLKEELKQSNYE